MGVYVSGQDVWKNSENGGRGKKIKENSSELKDMSPQIESILESLAQ